MIYRSKNIKETEKIATNFIQKILKEPKKKCARIVGLFGDLGAGKTEFLKGIAKTLKIKDTITSPTFVIEKFYKIENYQHPVLLRGGSAIKQSVSTTRGHTSDCFASSAMTECDDVIARMNNKVAQLIPSEEFFDYLIHIDAYRIENSDEILNLGWKEIAKNPKNLIFIEWPERLLDILPRDMDNIYLTFIDENIRDIEVKEKEKNERKNN